MNNFYKKHIFFCNNDRGDKLCCHNKDAKKMYYYAKDKCREIKILGKNNIGFSESKCLGRCNNGPVCVVYPEGIWYSYKNQKDIDKIIDLHLLNNKIVYDLQIN